ncbi:hypothetical protein T09_3138 [Trichinella sp. T9]|uniref:Uncharacterized protein n=1 Tax=Trichinella murrelli TaxID=144512 RepID=A0A0V0SVK7_9BILA|nr:hypothetical protein T09_3138 [Trichinella sp. T9]KRX30598.1 hypothetical protein T05_11455 [Trichinella murrelli]
MLARATGIPKGFNYVDAHYLIRYQQAYRNRYKFLYIFSIH